MLMYLCVLFYFNTSATIGKSFQRQRNETLLLIKRNFLLLKLIRVLPWEIIIFWLDGVRLFDGRKFCYSIICVLQDVLDILKMRFVIVTIKFKSINNDPLSHDIAGDFVALFYGQNVGYLVDVWLNYQHLKRLTNVNALSKIKIFSIWLEFNQLISSHYNKSNQPSRDFPLN